MPTNKHEGLKACLHLLCKDLNNLVELGTLLPVHESYIEHRVLW